MKAVTWLGGPETTSPSGPRAAWAEPGIPREAANHCCVPIGPRTLGSPHRPRYLLRLLAARFSGQFIDSLIH